MNYKRCRQRAKRLGILWIVSYCIVGIAFQICVALNPSPLRGIPADTLAARMFTAPQIAGTILVLAFFYPLLFVIRYNAKQAELRRLSIVSLLGIVLMSIWIFMFLCFSAIALIQLF